MKKRYWLLILLILMSVIGILNSRQKDEKRIINVYVESEIENYTQKLLKRYEKINEDIEIKLNGLSNLKSYDIILTNDPVKVKNIKRSYKEYPFIEDRLLIVGRRKINDVDELINSTIAIPNYETIIGKTAIDILSKSPNFLEVAKKINYKEDIFSSIESVDLYEVDFAVITRLSLPYLKNSEICYRFNKEVGENKIIYKAYIKNNKDKELRKIYNIIEDETLKK